MRTRRREASTETRDAWVERARCAVGEVAGAVEDMLRPHAKRELGPAVHRQLAREGLAALRALIESAPAASG